MATDDPRSRGRRALARGRELHGGGVRSTSPPREAPSARVRSHPPGAETHRAHGVHDQRTEDDRGADERHGADGGLSGEQAAARLARYGRNALEEERHSVLLEFLSHFWAPILWMIETAVVLTAVTARWADFGIILALLLLNGIVGFWEEHQAANALEALKRRLDPRLASARSRSTPGSDRPCPPRWRSRGRSGVDAVAGHPGQRRLDLARGPADGTRLRPPRDGRRRAHRSTGQ